MRTTLGLARSVTVAVMLGCFAPAAAIGFTRSRASVSLRSSRAEVSIGSSVTLFGRIRGASAGGSLRVLESPYPYRLAKPIASIVPSAGGAFSLAVRPDRSTRYSVRIGTAGLQAQVQVDVTGLTLTKLRALPLGRALVTIVVFHPRDLAWGGATVRWSFASGPDGNFNRTASTQTFRLSASATVLRTQVALPAGPYRFRACFYAPGDHALLNARRPPGCTGRGYHGGGSLPAGFPATAALIRAGAYLSSRTGRTAFAVVDTEGRLAGLNVHRTFPAASVVKAMLLVGYLRRLDALGQRRIDPSSASFLYPMIHVSDNNAATQCWSIVGDSGLYAVARAAGMSDFSVSGFWLTARLSPAGQARFFFEMDSLIPPEYVPYARFLLSTIEPSQSWGVPPVARPLGYQVFFKDGSEPTGLGQLVHQVDRLEGHGRSFAIATMTDGDPTMQYGIDSISGVGAALLG